MIMAHASFSDLLKAAEDAGFSNCPPGTYDVRVVAGEARQTGAGKDMIVVKFEIVGGAMGDTVLDVGCGTGLSFEGLRAHVGPTGRIVAFDPSPEMLALARERAARHGWTGLELLEASAGLASCLNAIHPRWLDALDDAAAFNAKAQGPRRRGVGIGCMWYGIGNTSMSNPSTMRIGLAADGTFTFYNGAVDIGQGVEHDPDPRSPPMRWACRCRLSGW